MTSSEKIPPQPRWRPRQLGIDGCNSTFCIKTGKCSNGLQAFGYETTGGVTEGGEAGGQNFIEDERTTFAQNLAQLGESTGCPNTDFLLARMQETTDELGTSDHLIAAPPLPEIPPTHNHRHDMLSGVVILSRRASDANQA